MSEVCLLPAAAAVYVRCFQAVVNNNIRCLCGLANACICTLRPLVQPAKDLPHEILDQGTHLAEFKRHACIPYGVDFEGNLKLPVKLLWIAKSLDVAGSCCAGLLEPAMIDR